MKSFRFVNPQPGSFHVYWKVNLSRCEEILYFMSQYSMQLRTMCLNTSILNSEVCYTRVELNDTW